MKHKQTHAAFLAAAFPLIGALLYFYLRALEMDKGYGSVGFDVYAIAFALWPFQIFAPLGHSDNWTHVVGLVGVNSFAFFVFGLWIGREPSRNSFSRATVVFVSFSVFVLLFYSGFELSLFASLLVLFTAAIWLLVWRVATLAR